MLLHIYTALIQNLRGAASFSIQYISIGFAEEEEKTALTPSKS